jgi:hypothetical protein
MKRSQLLAALDSVRAWVREQPDDINEFRLAPIPGLVVAVRNGRSPNAAKCARYRQRRATRVATGVTREPDTVSQPVLTMGPTRVATGVEVVSRPVSDPRPSSPPLHSPSDSLPPEPKEIAVVSEGSDRSSPRATATTAPRNHDEALSEPPGYVAGLCRDAMTADLLQAHRLPWVVEVLAAWHEARGGKDAPKIGIPSRDGGVRAVLELFAMGYGKNDLVRVARHLPTTDKFRDKVSASIMSPDVVGIALGELNERRETRSTPFARDLVRRVDSASRAPTPLGASLPRLVGGGGE